MAEPGKTRLPVTIIGGYLGSGKTTLINHLLRNAGGMRLAVLVNDFGELPIDRDLIEAEDGDIISIAGGCVCCSYGDDLIAAMSKMGELDPIPHHVVLETSGVAIPGPVANTLALLSGIRLDGIVVMADAETVADRVADRFIGDTVRRQLADADIIVANKTDLVDPDTTRERLGLLRDIGGGGIVVAAEHGRLPPPVILSGFSKPVRNVSPVAHDTGLFSSFVAVFPEETDAERLATELAGVELGLARSKGFVQDLAGEMRLVQTVARRSYIDPAPAGVETGVFCIGLDSTMSAAKSRLQSLFPGVAFKFIQHNPVRE